MIKTSTLVKSQFPEYYTSDGENLIKFLEAYYDWYEQSGAILAENLLEMRDIDSAPEELISYFKGHFLHNLPNLTTADLRNFIKHSGELFEARGTPQAIKLLLRLLFGVDSEIYYPGDDVLRASDGKWKVPLYLEVAASPHNIDLIGRKIVGGSSGATAIVENVVRRVSQGHYYDVLYISHLVGSFEYAEHVVDSSGELERAPLVIGSLNKIIITDGGKNNSVGDIFAVTSASGHQAVARVTAVVNATGRVEFHLEDGGTGYSANALTIVSEKMLNYVDSPVNSNSSITDFVPFESIEQPLFNIDFLVANGNFTVGDVVVGYTSGTWIKQANGVVMSVSQSGASGNAVIQLESGDFRFANVLHKDGNTITSNISTASDVTAVANVVASNTSAVGVFDVTNVFKLHGNLARVRGRQSNTYANIISFGSGSGADFKVGSINNSELVYVYKDFLAGNNVSNVSYLDVRLDGSGSGVGHLGNVGINAAGTSYANGSYLTFTGGGESVANVTVIAGGTNYANGEHVIAASGSNTALVITTNTTGGITAVSVIDGGKHHATPPTLTVNTTAGSGANLVATLSNATNQANVSITTDGSGAITSLTIHDVGSNYYSVPNVSVSGGTGANLTANMLFGYGFPKFPNGGNNDTISSTLDTQSINFGTVASISGISPGQDYNHSPFIRILEPYVAGLENHDLIIQTSNQVGGFSVGEQVLQTVTSNTIILTYSGISGNTGFDIGEIVSQNSNSAYGTVYETDGSHVKLDNLVGSFVVTSNTINNIVGLDSHAQANVTIVANGALTTTTKGIVENANASAVVVRPMSISRSFDVTRSIIGSVSGSSANIVMITSSPTSPTMGNNAVVTATVQTANGVATEVEVMSSGYGFDNRQPVTLTSQTNIYTISGLALAQHEGRAQGFFTSTDGFLSADKYLQDGYYYQPYSYEVRTSLSLDRYYQVLLNAGHVAGTKLFGKATLQSDIAMNFEVDSESIVQISTAANSASLDFSYSLNSQYVPII